MKQEYFEIGQIVNTFGIKGQVKVTPFTDDIRRFDELKTILVEKNGKKQVKEIEDVKYHKNMVLIKFKGIEDINMAETLRNAYLKIKREEARKLPQDTYYIADLLGLSVYTDEGEYLGKVDDIYSTKAHDIYVVKNEEGKQILLPGRKEVIQQVDLGQEKITVHLLEGLRYESKMKFDVLTLFPEMFEPLKTSIIGRAEKERKN